ncbi:MAG: HYR domain-containing protein, partial [Salegentibacter sp.]|uniref:HYR domain-containing protein n=1 Tax=Salegentibacter sp. TaxID=1903072 RepID=UPI0028703CA0
YEPGDTFPLGTTTVTYTLEDAAGNIVTASFDVTVEDNEDPVISGVPADITQDSDADSCDAVVTWTAPSADDNCSVESFTSNYEPGDTFPLGTTTVTYTLEDGADNIVTASFDVTVEDNEDPVINGMPANITQDSDAGSCDAVVTWTAPNADDNCSVESFTSNYEPGDTFPLGTTTVTYTLEDGAGNIVTASFDVTVEDNEDPVINGMPADITQDSDAGSCEAVVTWTAPNADDNCSVESFTSNYEPGDTFPLGTTTVTYTLEDAAGNIVTASFDVTVEDNEDPVINGMPADITQDSDADSCDAVVTWDAPTANDNCSVESFTSNYEPGDTFPLGTTTVTYTLEDAAGNIV